MTCAYNHICTIGDPFPVRAGEPCCETCTDFSLDLDTASPEQLGILIQGAIQRRGGPYLGALIVEGVAADVLASLGRPRRQPANECSACGLPDALNNKWRECQRCKSRSCPTRRRAD